MRIKAVLRDSDSVGRMGGDEFVVLLGDLVSTEDVVPIANKILLEVRQPLLIAGHTTADCDQHRHHCLSDGW
jgi:GGDEF domain-containing protein